MPMLSVAPGVSLAYEVVGQGPSIVLVHGFASNRQTNWIGPQWYETLTRAGRQVIAFDVRGHGASDKPHDSVAYDEALLAQDVLSLLDHLNVQQADYLGYSMGGFIGVSAVAIAPSRFRRVVLSGVGLNYVTAGVVDPRSIADGLLAPSLDDVTGTVPRQFRRFAEASGNDLKALAACMMRPRRSLAAPDLMHVSNSIMVIAGDADTVSGRPEPLAALFPMGEYALIPGRDHMNAVGDKVHKAKVLAFLDA